MVASSVRVRSTRCAVTLAVFALAVALGACGRGDTITAADRESAKRLVAGGIAFAGAGAVDSAEARFAEAVARDSTNAEAHYRLAMMFEMRGDQRSAMAEYQRALVHDSTLDAAYLNLGQILGRTGRYDAALAHFRAAIQHTKDDRVAALSWYCIGMAEGIRGNAARAVDAYAEAIAIDSAFARAYVGRGQELLRQDRTVEAVISLERAIALDSTVAEAYAHLASALRRAGQPAEAVAAEETARRIREARTGASRSTD